MNVRVWLTRFLADRGVVRWIVNAVVVLGLARGATAGIADSPLPVLDGIPSIHVFSVPGIIHEKNLGTVFFCTSYAPEQVTIAIEVFSGLGGPPVRMNSANVAPGGTMAMGTDLLAGIGLAYNLNVPANLGKGSARIVATSRLIECTAMVMDRGFDPPASMANLKVIAKTKQKGD